MSKSVINRVFISVLNQKYIKDYFIDDLDHIQNHDIPFKV